MGRIVIVAWCVCGAATGIVLAAVGGYLLIMWGGDRLEKLIT